MCNTIHIVHAHSCEQIRTIMTKKERQRYIKSTFDGVFRKKSQPPFLQNAQEIVKNYNAFCVK